MIYKYTSEFFIASLKTDHKIFRGLNRKFSQLSAHEVEESTLFPLPPDKQRVVPQLGKHFNKCCLSHTCLPLDDDRYATHIALVDVKHLDGVVQSENIICFINWSEPFVLEANVESSRKEFIKQVS